MPDVETTEGPIDADQLGRTPIHEHLMTASEAIRYHFPHLYDFDAERARSLGALRAVTGHGVDTFVDPGCMDLARDAALSKELAAEAGIQMVLCTGVYGQHYTFLPHHFQSRDEDYLADAFVHDIEADDKVQIAHTGDTDDLDHIEELLQTGCWIGLDRFGIDLFLPDDRRMPTFIELVSRGYTDRILLGCDAVANLDWFPPEVVAQLAPKWTHTHLFDEILAAAREAGVSDEQIRVMLEDNPKAWLTA